MADTIRVWVAPDGCTHDLRITIYTIDSLPSHVHASRCGKCDRFPRVTAEYVQPVPVAEANNG